MKQPFEPKYIKRYVSLYVGVVIAMILFYFLNSSNNPVESIPAKEFNTQQTEKTSISEPKQLPSDHGIRLLDKSY